jgi:hypothetical protein
MINSNCCFTGNTLITTDKGLLPIKNLVKKPVAIFDGNKWLEVNSFKSYGRANIYRVTLFGGIHFDVTKDHRFFLTNGKVVRTYELKVGDTLEYANQKLIGTLPMIPEVLEKGFKFKEGTNLNKVVSIGNLNMEEEVYCCTVPSTGKFLINSGIITGNSDTECNYSKCD